MKHDGTSSMVAGIVFNVFGIFMAFCGAIVDGVQAGQIGVRRCIPCDMYTVSVTLLLVSASQMFDYST
jgi:hypothetical protein